MNISSRILFEDNHLIAINKLPGELSQGDATGDDPLGDAVKAYLKEKYNKPGNVFLGVVHRIDRPVSGVIVFARTSKALSRMNELLKKQQLQKTYLALVEGMPEAEAGELQHYLYRLPDKNITKADTKMRKGAKQAILRYKLKEQHGKYSLLEVYPETGRQHQIRVQLSAMGCPIKGDIKYGATAPNKDKSICLHARAIEFVHPVRKEPLCIVAPVPKW